MAKSFDQEPLGEALLIAVRAAIEIPLNAIIVSKNRTLRKKLKGTLTEALAVLQKKEEKKAVDLMPRV